MTLWMAELQMEDPGAQWEKMKQLQGRMRGQQKDKRLGEDIEFGDFPTDQGEASYNTAIFLFAIFLFVISCAQTRMSSNQDFY